MCAEFHLKRGTFLSTEKHDSSKECQFSICVYKYTFTCMLLADASKVWNVCTHYVFCILCICWWARTKWEHNISLCMRRASKIGFNHKPIPTHTRTHTHAYTNTMVCLDAKTFAPFCSPTRFIIRLTRTHPCTQSALLWYGAVSAFHFDFHSTGNALFFSVFLRAPPFQSFSYRYSVCVWCIFIHTYMGLGRMLLCFFFLLARVNGERENTA